MRDLVIEKIKNIVPDLSFKLVIPEEIINHNNLNEEIPTEGEIA